MKVYKHMGFNTQTNNKKAVFDIFKAKYPKYTPYMVNDNPNSNSSPHAAKYIVYYEYNK